MTLVIMLSVLFMFLLIHAKSHSYSSSHSSSLNQSTATNQFGFLNFILMSFILTAFKSPTRHTQSSSSVILLGLLLSGDIHLNPGPGPTYSTTT